MHPFSSFFFLVLRVFVVTRQQKRIEVWLSTFSKSTNKIFIISSYNLEPA
jgi:hypothetical protein